MKKKYAIVSKQIYSSCSKNIFNVLKNFMKKYIDFLLIFFLIFFTFQFFTSKNQTLPPEGIVFATDSSSYSIPASIFLSVENNTLETLTFDSCGAISINNNGNTIALPEGFCGEVILPAGEQAKLDYSQLYTLFENPGTYIFELQLDGKKYLSQIEVKNRGTLGKIFVGLFYAPMYNLLAYIVQFFSYSLGWGIILMTIFIRILLLYPQHKMMVSQRKLQKIQPKIKDVQEKYKGDSQKLGLELMALYKKEKVNPMGSCGFLIIQMPILLVIYNIILNIKDPANAFHLYSFHQEFLISDISYNFFGIDLLSAGGVVGIFLALFIAVIQYIQIRLSLANQVKDTSKKWVVLEKKKWADSYNSMMPDPEMMNKFMLYGMPAMVAVFTYTLFAGIWLYWWVSTLFAILQQLFVNKIVKK